VQLGYWMSQLSGLDVVTFRRCAQPSCARARAAACTSSIPTHTIRLFVPSATLGHPPRRYFSWHDRWKAGVTDMLPRLLLAHKVPWARFASLLNSTELLWQQSPRALSRVLCEGPPCSDCAHVQDQHGCIVDIELAGAPLNVHNASTCWPRCKFTKATPPELPAMCWNDSNAFLWGNERTAAPVSVRAPLTQPFAHAAASVSGHMATVARKEDIAPTMAAAHEAAMAPAAPAAPSATGVGVVASASAASATDQQTTARRVALLREREAAVAVREAELKVQQAKLAKAREQLAQASQLLGNVG
jgi:hypothetical protein